MLTALICKRCSGSLPAPTDSPFVACSYCGTTHAVAAPKLELRPQAYVPSDSELRRAAISAAWDEARKHAPKDPTVALRAVLVHYCHAIQDEREAERAARLAERLLDGFDKEHRTDVKRDQQVVTRVAEAAVKAVIELRSVQKTDINLPFLTATTQGPLHLQHEVKRELLPQLDHIQVVEVSEATPPPSEKPKKKGWWPFG